MLNISILNINVHTFQSNSWTQI